MNIADFLRARFDEDEYFLRTMTQVGEQKAAEATPKDMADLFSILMTVMSDPRATDLLEMWTEGKVMPPNEGGRLLEELEGKRATLVRCEAVIESFRDREHGLFPDVSRREKSHASETLYDLARPYKDHPDYWQVNI